MNFGQAISSCLSKYATFSGRASRPEFWWFFLFQILISLAASMLGETINGLVALGLLLPALAVGSRRLHDIGKKRLVATHHADGDWPPGAYLLVGAACG